LYKYRNYFYSNTIILISLYHNSLYISSLESLIPTKTKPRQYIISRLVINKEKKYLLTCSRQFFNCIYLILTVWSAVCTQNIVEPYSGFAQKPSVSYYKNNLFFLRCNTQTGIESHPLLERCFCASKGSTSFICFRVRNS